MNQPLLPTSCILLTATARDGIETANEYICPNTLSDVFGNKPENPSNKPKTNPMIKLNKANIQYSFRLALPLKFA